MWPFYFLIFQLDKSVASASVFLNQRNRKHMMKEVSFIRHMTGANTQTELQPDKNTTTDTLATIYHGKTH